MSIPENFEKLTGEWMGTNRLHVPWMADDPIKESNSNASISFAANAKFFKLEYDWVYEGQRQEGLLIIFVDKESKASMVWFDSWHQSAGFMNCEGTFSDGKISVKGFYKVPEHPDWGWRTDLETEDSDSFKSTMYNVSPEGQEDLAVEGNFQRKA